MKRVRILRDTSGASIVIALVFFLICGIIGSVVMTAASVQAKAAQTHVDLQQKEYAMQSAAKLMAQQLGGEDAVWEEKSVVVKIAYDTAGEASVDTNSLRSMIGQNFWTEQRTKDILAARAEGKDYVLAAPHPTGCASTLQVRRGISPRCTAASRWIPTSTSPWSCRSIPLSRRIPPTTPPSPSNARPRSITKAA